MKNFIGLQFFLLFLLPITMLGQTPKKDLAKLTYDELKKSFWDNERTPKKQLEYANAYLVKAKEENMPIEKARGCFLLSLVLVSENDKALRYLDSAIVYTKDLNDTKYPAYAYSGKGYVYKRQFKYKEAINNFLIAENIAKNNNLDLYYDTKFSIATLRSEELGEVNEALYLYKQCFNYYKNKKIRTPEYSYSYQQVIFALADAYKALNQTDSATYYNKLGYWESNFTKDYEINALFTLNEGANLVLKKSYKTALDSIKKALPKMIFYKNNGNILASYFYLGKVYDGLNQKDKAVRNFIKVDSLYNVNKRITPEFVSGYPYLISYFKKNGDKENQLKYITKYMFIDSILQTNYKELTKKLQKEYDTPNLIIERESLIESLNNDKIKTYWGLAILFIITILATALALYQYQLKKKYRSRFEKIINKSDELIENQDVNSEVKRIKTNITKIEDIGIGEELIKLILAKLNRFEKENGYLESNITVQMLSTTFETNSKYVSRIVNVHKGKTFVQYINDLRIEHAIIKLKENNKLRKYTIQALALEFGFNNAESFSTAFYKKTRIKPTYFIKKLDVV
ncbi:AraC family transcriptional regulator [Flavobacterium sp. LS1R49]|uniref:AraC family transcriptional regulator n=1 Tax=Flavobacterium shii TaxID=2987687 RepID=A0A9X3BZM0_9FLAO|nr:helix-turn-helix domain-containing protein [Flavobacterium shii]MCV9930460.1 AraC family transcriptional regulator [Flavobacterium shii]